MSKQSEEKTLQETVFNLLCKHLDGKGWQYEQKSTDKNFMLLTSAVGKDLQMKAKMFVTESGTLALYSWLPFSFSKEKRMDGAVAVTMINKKLMLGSFDYDFSDGSVMFRFSNFLRGCEVFNDEFFDAVIMTFFGTIDNYNDKLLAVSTGIMSLEDFYTAIKGNDE